MADAEPSNVTVICGDAYATASASMSSSSQSCEYVTSGMSEQQVSVAIETSRAQGWTELADEVTQDDTTSDDRLDDQLVWEELKKRDPLVFRDMGEDELKLGRVIAEGGQAQILEASLKDNDEKLVAKVFKMEGFSLADLQRQWPRINRAFVIPGSSCAVGEVVFREIALNCSKIHWGTVLKDGRFAFVMPRYWGDLRTLINLKLKDNDSQGPPFSNRQVLHIIRYIAIGMRSLHGRGVLHRDLKAANILILNLKVGGNPRYDRTICCHVADFESSMFVQGTGFWRAPEVLQLLLKKPCDRNEEIWTEKIDAYSYAMTCYEILTGHLPFFGYEKSDWKKVIDGERPHFPDYVDARLQELVERCWHREPSQRPTFEIIVAELDNMMYRQ